MARSTPQSALRYPLTIILGADANVRLLRELALHGGLLSSPMLATRSGLARASVWSALGTLEAIGIVRSEGTGKARLYRINDRHPLAASLHALFEDEARRYSSIRAAVADAVAKVRPDAIAVWIYGSVARGEDGPTSDLDIAVILSSEALRDTLDDIRDALRAAGENLGFNPSVVGLAPEDAARLSNSGDPWWKAVDSDASTVLGARPD
ncbi:MAG: nucleotidyltransferase domain-containing protein, partial [Mesorhizobium sp.]|nr:nucleotidyltransferase domain-containing protein [Mesorhizobium sp.]